MIEAGVIIFVFGAGAVATWSFLDAGLDSDEGARVIMACLWPVVLPAILAATAVKLIRDAWKGER